jgi:hypothetical protein
MRGAILNGCEPPDAGETVVSRPCPARSSREGPVGVLFSLRISTSPRHQLLEESAHLRLKATNFASSHSYYLRPSEIDLFQTSKSRSLKLVTLSSPGAISDLVERLVRTPSVFFYFDRTFRATSGLLLVVPSRHPSCWFVPAVQTPQGSRIRSVSITANSLG